MAIDFEQVQLKSKQLIQDEKYYDALNLIVDALKDPLYNLEQQNILQQQITQLSAFIKNYEINKEIQNASKSQLIDFFITRNYELSYLDQLFEKYKDQLDENDFYKLNCVFLDKNYENELKINLLNIFHDYEIDHEFQFYNNKLKKQLTVNSKNAYFPYDCEKFGKIYRAIQALFYKDVTKESTANQITNKIFYYYFGFTQLVPFEDEQLIDNICNFVESCFNNIYPVDKKFHDWIKNIIE